MKYIVFMFKYLDKSKNNVTVTTHRDFETYKEAFLFANPKSKDEDFEHFEICRADNKELIYFKDCRGIIENYSK